MSVLLLLLSVLSASGGPPVGPTWAAPAPSFASSWFGGSLTEAEWQDPKQMAQLRKYKAILTSWILPFGNFSNATAIASSQAVVLKREIGAGVAVFTYQSGILAPGFYPENARVIGDPGRYGDFFLRTSNGTFLVSDTYCNQAHADPTTNPGCQAYLWNWCNESAIDYYVHEVLGAMVADSTGTGFAYDGVFLDNSDEFSVAQSANAKCNVTSATMRVHIETAKYFQTVGKWPVFSSTVVGPTMLIETEQLWSAGVGFSKFWESWNPSVAAMSQLFNETQSGLPTIVHATSHGWPFQHKPPIRLLDALASFLVATGGAPYTYFQYSSGWFDADWSWSPLFDQDYGTSPTPPVITRYGNASDLGEVWLRSFSTGAVVTVNCTPPSYNIAWCTGSIAL
jgi:hypothetical protein